MDRSKEEISAIRSENFRKARIKASEFFRSEEGKRRRKEQARVLAEKRPFREKTCPSCSKTFKTNSIANQKYCCNKCKSKHRRQIGIDNTKGKCIVCGKDFSYNKYILNLTCSRECLNVLKKSGEAREGHKNNDGYVVISRPGHPNSKKDGKLLEHTWIMSEHIKRPLRKGETVHHKNGIKNDNRIENLELWSHSHPTGTRIDDKIAWAKEFLEQNGYRIEQT
jgi:hypothetical protein